MLIPKFKKYELKQKLLQINLIIILSIIYAGSINSAQILYQPLSLISDVPDIQGILTINDNNSFTSCFTQDMNYHIYGSWDNDSRIHFIDTSGDPGRVGGGNFNITIPTFCSIVKISADGKYLAAGGGWGNSTTASKIYIINITTRTLEKEIKARHQYFELSPDGDYIAAIDNSSYSTVYLTSTGTLFKSFDRDVGLLKFSPDGRYLAVFNVSGNGSVDFLRFPEMTGVLKINGTPNFTLSPNREGILTWSPDGNYAAVIISSKNQIKIIDTNSWNSERTYLSTDDDFYFNYVSFSPGGNFLAAGGTTMEKAGVSLGLQIFNTADWSRVHYERNQIDYVTQIKDSYRFNDKYAIYDTIAWRGNNNLYLSTTLYLGKIELNLDIEADEPPDDLVNGDPPQDEINYVLIVGTGISVIIILSILGILSNLGLLPNPLYTKLKPDEILNQETRNNIYGYIHEHPGCDFSEIRKIIEISNSNLYYHLSVLEREAVIFSKTQGLTRSFYSSDFPKFSDLFPDTEAKGTHERIFMLLINSPGLTQKEIAANLKISEATVSRYIIDLLTEGFIKRERDGKVWRCYASFDVSV